MTASSTPYNMLTSNWPIPSLVVHHLPRLSPLDEVRSAPIRFSDEPIDDLAAPWAMPLLLTIRTCGDQLGSMFGGGVLL
jgi:hypothetical protein